MTPDPTLRDAIAAAIAEHRRDCCYDTAPLAEVAELACIQWLDAQPEVTTEALMNRLLGVGE